MYKKYCQTIYGSLSSLSPFFRVYSSIRVYAMILLANKKLNSIKKGRFKKGELNDNI